MIVLCLFGAGGFFPVSISMGAAAAGTTNVAAAVVPHRAPRSTAPAGDVMAEPSLARVDQIMANTASILWELSDHYFHSGEHEQCIRLGHLVGQIDPGYEDVYGVVAWLEWSAGNGATAAKTLEDGVRANPNSSYILSDLGDCYRLWLKNPAMAMPYYIRAADFYSQTPWVVYGSLAHAAESMGDYSRAVLAWQTARLKANGDGQMLGATEHNLQRVLDKIHQKPGSNGPGSQASHSELPDSGRTKS